MPTETTFGQDIDTFIATYVPVSKKELAKLELQLIALRANREGYVEAHESFTKAAFPSSK